MGVGGDKGVTRHNDEDHDWHQPVAFGQRDDRTNEIVRGWSDEADDGKMLEEGANGH